MALPKRLNHRGNSERTETRQMKRVVFLSVEGTVTEEQYLNEVNRFREELGIEAAVKIHVLHRTDTLSATEQVMELLENYVELRNNPNFTDEVKDLALQGYDGESISQYLESPMEFPDKERRRLEAILREEKLDLIYLAFLTKYRGENDVFGVVLDRDCRSHTREQLKRVFERCDEKGYHCFFTNPCIEFWLLLHVVDVKNECSNGLDKILQNPLDAQKNSYVSNLLHDETGIRKKIQEKSFKKYFLPNVDKAIERANNDFCVDRDALLDDLGSNMGRLFELLREKF